MDNPERPLISLSTLSLGQKAVVVAFSIETEQGERVQKLGLVPGEQLEVVRLSSPQDPIEIKIRGYFLSLRKEEADHIKVKLIP